MSSSEWLSFDAPPSAPMEPIEPTPAPQFLSQAAASRVIALPSGVAQWHYAIAELEGLLSSWRLPSAHARRWLSPAQSFLHGGVPLELYVELDPVVNLISVELWDAGGARLYGLDDYLPAV